MKLQHSVVYDAGPEAVFAMLGDPDFRRAACEAQGVVSVEVSKRDHGDDRGAGWSMVVDQVQRTDDLPSFARTFAGDTTQAIQREDWTDGTGGTFVIEAPGKPTGVTGTVTLRPEGAGTRETWTLDVRVKVPLIGGRLERLVADKITAGIEAEHAAGATYLEEHPA